MYKIFFMLKRCFLILITLVCILGCHSEKNKPEEKTFQETEAIPVTSAVVQIKTIESPSITYSVFLPASLDTTQKYPLVFFFDPHADGALPLEKYKMLGEKFKYILIGSNNSKNGMQLNEAEQIANITLRDAIKKFPVINTNRIYLCGFSGGANVVSVLASQFQGISGIIACSGGALQSGKHASGISYVSVAGLSDFNYNTLATANEQLRKSSFPFLFLTGDYKHEWAPSTLIDRAFMYLELQAVKNKTTVNNQIIKDTKEYFDSSLKQSQKNSYEEFELLQQEISMLKGLADVSTYTHRASEIEHLTSFKNNQAQRERLKAYETEMQQTYQLYMQSANVGWWKKEIDRLKNIVPDGYDKMAKQLADRLLGYIGIISYTYCKQGVMQNNFGVAKNLLEIYRYAEPENAEACFLSARAYAENNLKNEAKEFLKCALKNKMDDTGRIERDNSLREFLADPAIAGLMHQ